MNSTDFREYLEPCCEIAREAATLILAHPPTPQNVRTKVDTRTGRESHATLADDMANAHIVARLQALTPHIPVIAEEDEDHALLEKQRSITRLFWLVDPLDGTRAFVEGKPDYSINIALVYDTRPVLGVVGSPAEKCLYWGDVNGAFRMRRSGAAEPIRVSVPGGDGYVVVKSASHPSARMQRYLDSLSIRDIRSSSGALKFCKVAEGSAHIYPRLGNTMEWDTAAGQAILEAAGGLVLTENGLPLSYNKPHFENPGFIASFGPVMRKLPG